MTGSAPPQPSGRGDSDLRPSSGDGVPAPGIQRAISLGGLFIGEPPAKPGDPGATPMGSRAPARPENPVRPPAAPRPQEARLPRSQGRGILEPLSEDAVMQGIEAPAGRVDRAGASLAAAVAHGWSGGDAASGGAAGRIAGDGYARAVRARPVEVVGAGGAAKRSGRADERVRPLSHWLTAAAVTVVLSALVGSLWGRTLREEPEERAGEPPVSAPVAPGTASVTASAPASASASASAPVASASASAGASAPVRPAPATTTAAPKATKTPAEGATGPQAAGAAASRGQVNSSGTDLASGRPVEASSYSGAGTEARLAVDGDSGTRWVSEADEPEWISVDLGRLWSVSRVELDWHSGYADLYRIEVSSDNQSWRTVYSTRVSTGGNEKLSFSATPARYVRMYGLEREERLPMSLYRFAVR
jgi:hypothetical protein